MKSNEEIKKNYIEKDYPKLKQRSKIAVEYLEKTGGSTMTFFEMIRQTQPGSGTSGRSKISDSDILGNLYE